jgi:cytochrome c1
VIDMPVRDGCKQTAKVESPAAVKRGQAANKSRRKPATDDRKYNPARSPVQRDSRMNCPGSPSAAPARLLRRSCADGSGRPRWNSRVTNGCNRHAFPLPTGQAKGMPAAMQSAETMIFLSRRRSLIYHSGSRMRVWR